MQKISVNTILRTDRVKAGLYPIYIRIIANRKKIDVRVSHYVQEGDLLPNNSVKQACFNSWAINTDIQATLDEINKIILFHRLQNITLTSKSFSDLYHKKIDTTKLHLYVRTQAAQMPITKNRLFSYIAIANHIEKYFNKISLADCNYNFILQFEKTLLHQLNFKQNSITSAMARLKAILNIAYKKKLIKENPFIHYRLKPYTSNRQFLTKNEVLLIEKYYSETTNKTCKNVAAIFLFLCYTGLRIGDFTSLKFDNIKDGCIELIQSKGLNKNVIPISTPGLRFINENGFNFKIISATKTNKYLKQIALEAGITKPLTCHVARHTFATLSLQLEMSIPIISRILGHTKISTTMIYAKVLNESKKIEIAKWDSFLGFKA